MEHINGSGVPELELIIKASTIDGRRKGACIFCHEYFMELYLLAELKTISLKVSQSQSDLTGCADLVQTATATPRDIHTDEKINFFIVATDDANLRR
jgi:hypothetical protein